jgi:hypothetical protein
MKYFLIDDTVYLSASKKPSGDNVVEISKEDYEKAMAEAGI